MPAVGGRKSNRGYNETVKNITNDDIKYFYQNRFGTNDVKFFIVG
ncbi:MAG: hypothetical protein FD143_3053, partial [Ignavibacteria bacterium]